MDSFGSAGCRFPADRVTQQLSYSIFFTRAGGGRLEAGIVTVLTFVLFLVASLLLPYVPTVLASALVLFLGIELTLEAVWESAKTMLHAEFFVVIATLIACTFLGFAPGFGVGIAAAAVVYMIWGVVDSVSMASCSVAACCLQVSSAPNF